MARGIRVAATARTRAVRTVLITKTSLPRLRKLPERFRNVGRTLEATPTPVKREHVDRDPNRDTRGEPPHDHASPHQMAGLARRAPARTAPPQRSSSHSPPPAPPPTRPRAG